MNVLTSKLLRDLRFNWQMIFAVSAIIAVGISCFVGMLSAVRNLEDARSTYYSTCRLADFWLDLKKVPVQEVHRLASISGVSEVRDRIQFPVVLDLEGSEKPVSAMLLSMPDVESPVVNNIILRKGTYFSPSRPNEVIVSEKFAIARNIEPGDTIIALLHNQRRELIVTGTAISAEFVYMASPGSMVDEPGSYGLLFIKRSFADDTFGFNSGCNSVVGLLTPEARMHAKRILAELTERFSDHGVFIGLSRTDQFSTMVLDGEMTQLEKMAYIFPLIFLVVAALILNVLMTRLADQQRSSIGTLKAIGYTNRDLMSHFLQFSVVTGLVGGGFGCLMGVWFGGAITTMYVDYFTFPQLTSRLYPGLLLAGMSISVFFAVLGTIKGVLKIMRLDPAEAMRQAAPPVGGKVILERVQWFWSRLDAQWHMILRGLLRNKGRTSIAIVSAAMGSSIVVLAFGFVDSMDEMVHLQFERVLRSDYHLTFNRELGLSALDEVRRLQGVENVEPVLNIACTFRVKNHTKRGAVSAIVPGGVLTTPLNEQGLPVISPPAGLLMTKRLMEKLHLKVGDTVEVIPVKGEHKVLHLPVVEGIESMLGLAVYADFNYMNRMLGQEKIMNELRLTTGRNNFGKREFLRRLKAMPNLENVTDVREQKQALEKQMNGAMRASAVIMILFAAVIFFGAIVNGTLIAIAERNREMATFRTMGYFENEVGKLFLRENMLTNIIGTLLGLGVGYWMLTLSMKGFVSDAYSFPAEVTPLSFVYTMLLAIMFVLLAHMFVLRKLKQQNWVEALSLKE